MTYRELDERSNQLARFLRSAGVVAETIVGVALERTPEMIVALLGILKAGGAYLPLTGDFPPEHNGRLLAQTHAEFVIADRSAAFDLDASGARVIFMDDEAIAGSSRDALEDETEPQSLAYIIFTSGSTGEPKGVMIEQRSLVSFLEWARRRFGLQQLAGVLASTTLAFDVSVFEIFAPLVSGGTIVLVPALLDHDRVADPNVTMVCGTASILAEALRLNALPIHTRTILQAGERLSLKLARELFARTNVDELINLCGATEDTVYSVSYVVPRDVVADPPIGQPFFERHLYLLDDDLNPVPDGEAGEIYYGGSGVARGYLNRPELTAERFLPDRYSPEPGARMYRSGDLGRRRSDGNVEFLGRNDSQVKIRGVRIELGHIEAELRRHPAVAHATVVMREVDGEPRICAYYVAKGTVTSEDLLAHCARMLHSSVVPSYFIAIEALPVTPSGKLEVSQLPSPVARESAVDRSTWNAEELAVAAAFANALRHERFGRDDNFFSVGGHSLTAARAADELASARGTTRFDPVLLEAFRTRPTVAGIAQALAAHASALRPAAVSTQEVRLIQSGDRSVTPVIFFEGDILGAASYCWSLAASLGSQTPFFSIASQGRDEGPVATTIGAMADTFLPIVRALCPRGPFRLGGYCGGGLLALEIATRLRAAGETVEHVGLVTVDAGIIRFRAIRTLVRGIADAMQLDHDARRRAAAKTMRILNALYRWRVRFARSPIAAFGWLVGRLTMRKASPKRWVFDAITDAIGTYDLPAYDGSLAIVVGEQNETDDVREICRHWSAVYPQATIAVVPGGHDAIVTHTAGVARALDFERTLSRTRGESELPAVTHKIDYSSAITPSANGERTAGGPSARKSSI